MAGMPRSFVDVLPSLTAPDVRVGDVSKVARRPVPRWLLVFGFWTLIVLAYSTRGEVRGLSGAWMTVSRVGALKAAVAQWYSWGLLSVAIYWINRKLPFAPDALVRRLLVHVPLSIVFTVAYGYLSKRVPILLDAS